MTKECIIYAAVNVSDLDGKKIYVGMTERELFVRKYHHEYAAERGSKLHFHRAIKKYSKNFVWLIVGRSPDFFSGLELERKFISFYKNLGFDLYNHTDGGGGVKGLKMNAATREKMAAKKRGKPNHWSDGRMPQWLRNKIAETRRNEKRILSVQAREAIRANALKANEARSIPVVCLCDGRIFKSSNSAGRYYGIPGNAVSYSARTGKTKFGLTFSRSVVELPT